MLTNIHPKLPMKNLAATKDFYTNKLGFTLIADYGEYLIVRRDNIEIHFFAFAELDPLTNYGQVYIRTDDIESLYAALLKNGTEIHPNGQLETKPWAQKEFSLLDSDHNLLTFGQAV